MFRPEKLAVFDPRMLTWFARLNPSPDQAQRKMLPELKLLAQSQIERAERAGEADVRRNGVDWAAGLTRVRPWASGRAFHFSIRAFN